MDASKVKIFTEFCICLGMYGYLDLDDKDLLCFYEECLIMAEYLGNISITAYFIMLNKLGDLHQQMNQFSKALQFFDKTIRFAINIGFTEGKALAMQSAGNVLCSQSKYEEAIEYYEKSLHTALDIGDKSVEGAAYSNLGNVYQSLGKYMEAIKHHKKTLNIVLEIGEKSAEGNVYCNLGNAYTNVGKYMEAIKYNDKSLKIALELGDKSLEEKAYGNLGNVYKSLGKYMEAITLYEKSLSIALELGDKSVERKVICNLGNVYQSLGKYMEAIKNYEKSLNIALEIGDKSLEGTAYCNLGSVYRSFRKYMEAIKYYKKSLDIALELPDKRLEGAAYCNLGSVYQSIGEYMEAIKQSKKSLNIALELGDKSLEGTAYGSLGRVYAKFGKYQEALEYYEKCLRIAKEIGSKSSEAEVNYMFGLLYYSLNTRLNSIEHDDQSCKSNKELSIRYLKESVRCWEYVFEYSHEQDDSKISIVDTFIDAYKLLTTVLIETNQTEEALLVCDRGRARALGDILMSKYGIDKEHAFRSITLGYPDVKKMLSRNNFCILFFAVGMKGLETWVITSEKPLLFRENEIIKLGVQFEKVDKQDKKEDKAQDKNMEKTQDKENKAEDKTQVEEDKEDKTQDKTKVRTEDEEDKTQFKTKGIRETLLQVIHDSVDKMKVRQTLKCENRSLQSLRNDNQDDDPDVGLQASQDEETQNSIRQETDPLETLFNVLITPVLQNLEQEEIVIIPDGLLYMVPFAALRDPNTGLFLSETKRIRLAPSLATLKILQAAGSHCKRGALVVGDPDAEEVLFQGENMFPRLPKAKHEAEIIGAILNAKPVIGSKATKENVKDKLQEGVAIIHIAAHGSSENGNIVLAPPARTGGASTPKEEDYMLTMQEVQEIGVKAQLVVLSCCHSGRGEIKSEGVVGMSRAFLAAGARAVVASLWAVDDEATLSFMVGFYTYLQQGESASKSLQQAMKELREDVYSEPIHWAPFFLIGDDVSVYEKERIVK